MFLLVHAEGVKEARAGKGHFVNQPFPRVIEARAAAAIQQPKVVMEFVLKIPNLHVGLFIAFKINNIIFSNVLS